MSDETKTAPTADQTVSSESKLGGTESKSEDTKATPTTGSTIAESASNAASTATAAATGVKDSVFSMFGGGGKKEKKADEDDEGKDEPSGSSKAKKEAEDDEVSFKYNFSNTKCTDITTGESRGRRNRCSFRTCRQAYREG